MVTRCHSVIRSPATRVTREGVCGEILDSTCAYAVTESIVTITLTKVFQERQEALQLNANGDICYDKPKRPVLRWYEVVAEFCQVDPELFNIISNEPLVLNDEATPRAIGWCTLPDSNIAANFGLEFWTGTEDEGCTGDDEEFGYGLLPRITQGTIGNVTIGNAGVNFTVTGITRGSNQWGQGPYNVIINETGANAGFPADLLVNVNTAAHKCFFWTKLPPPPGMCGCQDLTPVAAVLPLGGASPLLVTLTFPTLIDGTVTLPAVINWDDGTALQVVTAGTSVTHTYAAPGTFNAEYRPTGFSSPTYISANIVVT